MLFPWRGACEYCIYINTHRTSESVYVFITKLRGILCGIVSYPIAKMTVTLRVTIIMRRKNRHNHLPPVLSPLPPFPLRLSSLLVTDL